MGAFLIILAYIFVICEAIWYFSCTKHEEIPLIIVLAVFVMSLIPSINIAFAIVNLFIFRILCNEKYIVLKDNWFNRKFLAYRE